MTNEELLYAIKLCTQRTISLDDPITENLTVADTIADTKDDISDLIEKVDREQAAGELWSEVEKLDYRQAEAIRQKFIDGMTVQEISENLKVTKYQAAQAIQSGCRKLRRKKKVQQLAESFGISSSVYHGSLSSFMISGCSSVERIAIRNIEGGEEYAD